MEIGDLIRAINDNTLFSGYGIITEIDPTCTNWVRVYWFTGGDYGWEQIYHIETYCEKGS